MDAKSAASPGFRRHVGSCIFRGAHAAWRALPAEPRRRLLAGLGTLICPRPSLPTQTIRGPVTVAGFLYSTTSLGEGARLCLRSLASLGYDIRFADLASALHQRDFPTAAFPGSPAASGGGPLIVHANPHMLPLGYLSMGGSLLRQKYVIGYFTWELPEIPRTWRRLIDLVHEIWVPSEFVAKAFGRRTRKPIRVVPHPIATEERLRMLVNIPQPGRARFGIPDDAFTVHFMQHMGSGINRKNPIGAIRAFKQAFGDDPKRFLLVKLADTDQWPRALARIKTEIGGAPNIVVMHEKLTADELLGLISCCDAIISLHRAEGFGMVLAEAMMLGKPVIATRYSGNLEFMTDENSALVPCSLCAVSDDQKIYLQQDQMWAEPDIDAAAAWLRRLASDRQLCRTLGNRAREEIGQTLDLERYAAAVRDGLSPHYAAAGQK